MRATAYLAVAVTCASCGGEAARASGQVPQGPTHAGTGSFSATYRGGQITQDDVASELRRLPPALRESFGNAAGQRELARSLVDKRLLVEEARRLGIAADPSIRKQVNELEERLLVQALLTEEERKAGAPSEAELRAFFEANAAQFERPARAHIARILAAVAPEAPAADKAKARAKAERWLARRLKGESFAKLAAEGDGDERSRGGDFGFLIQGQGDDPELAKAAFALAEPHKPSMAQCREGVAVIELLQKYGKRLPAFEEVRGEVEGRVAPVRKRRVFDGVLARLRSSADVRVDARPP